MGSIPCSAIELGGKYGRWTVLSLAKNPGAGTAKCFLCRCECGFEKIKRASELRSNRTRGCSTCGNAQRRIPIPIGSRFGSWTILVEAESRDGIRCVLCRCDCGTEKTLLLFTLYKGQSQACQRCLGRRFSAERKGKRSPSRMHTALTVLIDKYRKRALRNGREWALNADEAIALFMSDCYYCGAPPGNTISGRERVEPTYFVYSGLDRRDNGQGYTPKNAVPCCITCNRAKRDMGYEEFLAWVTRTHGHLLTSGLID